MYATAAFDFNQGDNGWLMAEFAFMRSIFLIFIFPRIIDLGRKLTSPSTNAVSNEDLDNDEEPPQILIEPQLFQVPSGEQVANGEASRPSKPANPSVSYVFDLVFLRWSLVVDGALTTVAAFATRRWHIYLGMINFCFLKACSTVSCDVLLTLYSGFPPPIRIRFRPCCKRSYYRNVF